MSKNAKLHIIELLVLLFLSGIGVYMIPILVAHINLPDSHDNNMASAICGAAIPIIVVGIINIYRSYQNTNKLEKSLLMEVGLIARALYHDIETNKAINNNIGETFNVNHAIVHNIGADISLVDDRTACDILEFHSLIKVLNNITCMEQNRFDTSDTILKRITEIVNYYPQCVDIIKQSKLSFKNYAFWKEKL